MRGFPRRSARRPLVTATLVCAVVCGVAVVTTGDAATVPKCRAFIEAPCYYNVRIETSYTNGAFVMGSTFEGSVSARITATFRRVPIRTLWRRGVTNYSITSGKEYGKENVPGTLRATVSADIRSIAPGVSPCRVRGSYQRPAVLNLVGFAIYLKVSFGLTRQLAFRCPGTAIRLHHIVDGHRTDEDATAITQVNVGDSAAPAAPNRNVRAFDWSYDKNFKRSMVRSPVPLWARLTTGRSFGVTHTYTGPGEPTRSSGSFGTSESALVRITFTRVR